MQNRLTVADWLWLCGEGDVWRLHDAAVVEGISVAFGIGCRTLALGASKKRDRIRQHRSAHFLNRIRSARTGSTCGSCGTIYSTSVDELIEFCSRLYS